MHTWFKRNKIAHVISLHEGKKYSRKLRRLRYVEVINILRFIYKFENFFTDVIKGMV